MAWPKGVPRKKKETLDTGEKSHNKDMIPSNKAEGGSFGDDRDKLYEKYNQFVAGDNGEVEQTPQQEATPEPVAEVQPEPEQATEQPAEQEVVAEEPKVELPEEVKQEPEKKVPLAALHEARNEIKELKRRLGDYENQRLQSLTGNQEVTEEEYVTRRELKTLQEKLDGYEREKSKNENERNFDLRDNQLAKRGIMGYKKFLPLVEREISNMYITDPEYAAGLDNHDGWMQVYEERVFPEIKHMFVQDNKQNIIQKKIEAKKDAGMVANPGIPSDKKPEVDKPKTTADMNREYLDFLRASKI